MITRCFVPGEVSLERLEVLCVRYEAAEEAKRQAYSAYEAAYHRYCWTFEHCREAKSVYEWAQHGMVERASE